MNEIKIIKYRKIIELENLKLGLARTKNNVSPGLDGEIKKDISEKRLIKLHNDLASQKYKPTPSKRVGIPRPDGGTRYLGISSQMCDKKLFKTIYKCISSLLIGMSLWGVRLR